MERSGCQSYHKNFSTFHSYTLTLHTHDHYQNEKLFECQTAEKIHELIKHGASVDCRKANGSTPLIVHSSAGNKEVVQALYYTLIE